MPPYVDASWLVFRVLCKRKGRIKAVRSGVVRNRRARPVNSSRGETIPAVLYALTVEAVEEGEREEEVLRAVGSASNGRHTIPV